MTQHLQILEAANLLATVRRGREKLHHLNPVPLVELQERWVHKFDDARIREITAVARTAEGSREAKESTMGEKPAFVYVTFIQSTAERVWDALTDAQLTAEYWGHSNRSDWHVGSEWRHVRTDGSDIADVTGRILESDRPRRLAMTFGEPDDRSSLVPVVVFELEPFRDIVKLTITHEHITTDLDHESAALGWAAVAANLKSLLETGRVLSSPPWELHADLREQQLQGGADS